MLKKISYTCNSIQGHQREKNQDGIMVIESDSYNLYIIFDGLSSHAFSFKFIDIYKQYIFENHSNYLDSEGNNLDKLIFHAHIETVKQNIDGLTTIAGIFLSDKLNIVKYFSIGDSRIYTINDKKIQQITVDDNISMFAHLITRCLGMESLTLADCEIFNVGKENNFLLCTDGFYPLMHNDLDNYMQIFQMENPDEIKTILFDIQKDINLDDSTYILVKQDKM